MISAMATSHHRAVTAPPLALSKTPFRVRCDRCDRVWPSITYCNYLSHITHINIKGGRLSHLSRQPILVDKSLDTNQIGRDRWSVTPWNIRLLANTAEKHTRGGVRFYYEKAIYDRATPSRWPRVGCDSRPTPDHRGSDRQPLWEDHSAGTQVQSFVGGGSHPILAGRCHVPRVPTRVRCPRLLSWPNRCAAATRNGGLAGGRLTVRRPCLAPSRHSTCTCCNRCRHRDRVPVYCGGHRPSPPVWVLPVPMCLRTPTGTKTKEH
jgi:hypothetical protein